MHQNSSRKDRLFILIAMTIMLASLYVWSTPASSNSAASEHVVDKSSAQEQQQGKEAGNNAWKEDAKIASSPENVPASKQELEHLTDHPFDPHDMSLMGIHLDDSSDYITSSWGEPSSSYVMPEEDPVKVLEYDGFSVGCTAGGHIAFVEVHQAGLRTGIEGLQVGEHSESVKEALGAPDQDSGYVWGYYSNQSMLRLDLDPTTSKIHAVKLFRSNA
ncbi:hypothetical protein [Paenibacillus sp. 1001270B_150601_E10]|uniref:hypothetical protein n=1 Tax=Paenibacillus sp. 1001270B_150601_E10 TaxID=2787079 RepID=UPI00189EDF6A|nr:hypothetical protein [Paenibacillus sp. 1001270B_150601_E10]